MGGIEDKLSLYADNMLLYLRDMSYSLSAVLQIIDKFSTFSQIRVNWEKSPIFPLSTSNPKPVKHTLLCWVDKFKYLGIQMGSSLATKPISLT